MDNPVDTVGILVKYAFRRHEMFNYILTTAFLQIAVKIGQLLVQIHMSVTANVIIIMISGCT